MQSGIGVSRFALCEKKNQRFFEQVEKENLKKIGFFWFLFLYFYNSFSPNYYYFFSQVNF